MPLTLSLIMDVARLNTLSEKKATNRVGKENRLSYPFMNVERIVGIANPQMDVGALATAMAPNLATSQRRTGKAAANSKPETDASTD